MTTIKDAVDDLLNNHQLSAEEAVDRHFGPTFRQRVNGSWDDRAGFLARVTNLRKVVEYATITVLEELTDGSRYAEPGVLLLPIPRKAYVLIWNLA